MELLLGKRKVKNYAGEKKESTDRTGRQAGGQENGSGRQGGEHRHCDQ